MIRQVSSQLLSPTEKLKVQLSVGLVDSSNNPSYCNIYNGENGSYLNITPFTQVSIKYVEKGRPWNRLDNIYITQRNIFAFRIELKLFYDKIMDHADDIYKYGPSGYITSMGDTSKYTKSIILGPSQIMQLEPATIYGENGRPLPGIYMEINQKANLVELSMDEFESFYDLFQTIQIHQEGMLLLQTYMMTCLKSDGLKIPIDRDGVTGYKTSNKDVKVNIFEVAQNKKQVASGEHSEFVSGPPINNQISSLEDLQ